LGPSLYTWNSFGFWVPLELVFLYKNLTESMKRDEK
jgi:hypothetical protein